MEKFGCYAYTDKSDDPQWKLANVPTSFALRLDLDYSNGEKAVLIYTEMPSQDEQRNLMWKLQTIAARVGYKLTRTEPGIAPIVCPPIKGD